DALAPQELVVPVVVLDVSKKVQNDPDYAISGNDIVDWEDAFGPVPVGGVLLAYTGWGSKFANADAYLNQDDRGVMHFPGFGGDAAAMLVERDVAGIGIDTLSVDPGNSTEFSTHKQMLKAGKYMIENLANLERMPTTGAILIVGVLPVADGTQAQARVMALLPEKSPSDEGEGS
ncbi:MAG TPA: cyclase family protein, partial [Polyangiaceae bacterium]|nr:cyclase family protein [Polyangiaceae bacterium]